MLNQTVSDSWNFFLKHWKFFFLVYLPIFAIPSLFDQLIMVVTGESYYYLAWLAPLALNLVAEALFIGISVFYIADRLSDKHTNLSVILRRVKEKFLPLLHLTLNVFLVTLIGLMLFIVPGIILIIKLSFSVFELLFNDVSPRNSMKLSWYNTSGYFGLLLCGLLIFSVPFYMLFSLILIINPESWTGSIIAFVAYLLVDFLISSLMVIFFFRIYDLYKADSLVAQETES